MGYIKDLYIQCIFTAIYFDKTLTDGEGSVVKEAKMPRNSFYLKIALHSATFSFIYRMEDGL